MNYPQQLINELLDNYDRYRLIKHLSGRVYLAMDLFTGESVGFKLLRRLSNSQENIDFAYEMALHYAIGNDYVVQVKDFGLTKTGAFFYTMEYLPGVTLSKATITPDRGLLIIKQICQALGVAHQGVILSQWNMGNLPIIVPHKKLHPDHIMVLPNEQIKVLNFGFISEADPHKEEETSDSTLVTSFGGEFHYIAPEQLEKVEGDTRSDVYVLGMMLYEMLCGTNPYGIQIQNGLPWVMAHATMSPVPVTQRSGCEHFPPELDQIILKCLAKKPDQRYDNALHLLSALESVPSFTPIADDNITEPHIFDEGSRIIPEPDGTKTITLSPKCESYQPASFDREKTVANFLETQATVANPPEAEATVADPPVFEEFESGLGSSFTTGDYFNSYSTFLENKPKQNKLLLLLIAGTVGVIVGLVIFTILVLRQRQNSPPETTPPPLDRSI